MVITGIFRISNKKSVVEFDHEIRISLYNREISKFGLELHADYPEEDYHQLLQDILYPRAKERVYHLLIQSDRAESDVREKLQNAYYPQEIIDIVIEKMRYMGYIDDERYARNYISNHYKQKSIKMIYNALMRKGISKECMEQCMNEIIEEQQDSGNFIQDKQEICQYNDCIETAQKAIIYKEIEKRHYFEKKELSDERECMNLKQKIISSLMRKGFSYDEIESVFLTMEREKC